MDKEHDWQVLKKEDLSRCILSSKKPIQKIQFLLIFKDADIFPKASGYKECYKTEMITEQESC